VHLTQLRINSEDCNGYPLPGQKLCFTVTTDRRGRKRADVIFDGTDFVIFVFHFVGGMLSVNGRDTNGMALMIAKMMRIMRTVFIMS